MFGAFSLIHNFFYVVAVVVDLFLCFVHFSFLFQKYVVLDNKFTTYEQKKNMTFWIYLHYFKLS